MPTKHPQKKATRGLTLVAGGWWPLRLLGYRRVAYMQHARVGPCAPGAIAVAAKPQGGPNAALCACIPTNAGIAIGVSGHAAGVKMANGALRLLWCGLVACRGQRAQWGPFAGIFKACALTAVKQAPNAATCHRTARNKASPVQVQGLATIGTPSAASRHLKGRYGTGCLVVAHG